MLLIIYMIAALIIVVYLLYNRTKSNSHLQKIPDIKGIPSVPIFGQALYVLFNRTEIAKLLFHYPVDATPVKGKFLNNMVLLVRPEDIQVVLTSSKCLSKINLYHIVRPYVGDGLITASVQKWKKNRKMVQPTFNQVILNQFVEVFSKNAAIFTEEIDKFKGETFDVFSNLFKYSIDVMFETSLNFTPDTLKRTSKLATDFKRGYDIMMHRIINIFLYLDPIFQLTNLYKEEKGIIDNFNALVAENLKKKKEDFISKLEDKKFIDSDRHNILINKLLELQMFTDKLSDSEIVDEVKTFIITGSETTAATAAIFLVMLGMHPEIQEKVYDEIIDIIGPTKPVNYTDIDKFEYLDKVIKETLRIFPVGGFIARKSEEDIKLATCTIPKGCDILISLIALMRSNKYYPDPFKFDPERFNPEEVKKRHPYTFLPFSGGPRNCIGKQFAIMSLKTVLPTCIREFRFETDYKRVEDIELEVSFFLKATNGYPIRAIRRNN